MPRTTHPISSPDIIERVVDSFTPTLVRELLGRRTVFVAWIGPRIVGTASLEGGTVRTVFVAPDAQGRGIGRLLMAEVERIARERRLSLLMVPSSATAEPFYRKLGFQPVLNAYYGDERTIIMERSLVLPPA